MIRVKMLTTSAGPDGTVQAGTTIPVDAETAMDLVNGGYAVYVDPPPAPSEPESEPDPAPPESPSAAPASEPQPAPPLKTEPKTAANAKLNAK